jgi:hypothetical protein
MEKSVMGWEQRIKLWAMGVGLTNGFNFFKYMHRFANNDNKTMSRSDFTELVIDGLLEHARELRHQRVPNPGKSIRTSPGSHQWAVLAAHPLYQQRAGELAKNQKQKRCRECGKTGGYFCVRCSNPNAQKAHQIYSLCISCRGNSCKSDS